MKLILRLEFNNVFPDEKQKNILEYLKEVSPDFLLNIIGLLNSTDNLDFNNFFSNAEIQQKINKNIKIYLLKNKHIPPGNIKLLSNEASLRFAEIILSNRKLLIDDNSGRQYKENELNVFKAILIINKEINSKPKFKSESNDLDKIIDHWLELKFPISEFGLIENNDFEFVKLIYTTIVRFDYLIQFLQSNKNFIYLEEALYKSFKLKNTKELIFQIKYLFLKLFELKKEKQYKFCVNQSDEKIINFLNSLHINDLYEDEDYTTIKKYPIYKINNNEYSIINYYFLIDKFNKGLKFILKDAFEKNPENKERNFFSFFNKEFSEEFLMKNVLDEIFNKSFFKKKKIIPNTANEPDYYVRYQKKILLFEFKDVLINKKIKSSGDIQQIDKVIKEKFFGKVGVGQLINLIDFIVNQRFNFDDFVNNKKNLTVYPILLMNDRIFEVHGLNYKMNKWYLDLVKSRLKEKYKSKYIKDLTVLDLDTLIYLTPFIKEKPIYFFKMINDYLKQMKGKKKVLINGNIDDLYTKIFNSIAPFSWKYLNYKMDIKLILSKFDEVLKADNKELSPKPNKI